MDCQRMADRVAQMFATHVARHQSNTKERVIRRKHRQTSLNLTLSSLGIVTSLLLALMPISGTLPSVAVAQDQTSAIAASSNQQVDNVTGQDITGQNIVQIQETIATINSPSGASARAQPDADADIIQILKQGETFSVAGRSYDEDAGAEWVSLKAEADELLWVQASSIDSSTETVSALAATVAPIANILNTDEEIVYIDNVGRIKVFDAEQAGDQRVVWESPEIAFTDFALGDFNNDGDDEIVGIRGVGAAGELIVYDPVLNSTTISANNAGTTEIPWAELYRQTIGFTPTIVETGELDQGIPGDEILFGYTTGSTTSEIVVIKGNSLTPDGTGWLKHIPGDDRRGVIFPYLWETVSIGNLNGSGTDEVVFTVSTYAPKSFLQVYRIDNGGLNSAVSVVDLNSSSRSWRGSTIANVRDDDTPELIHYRKATGNSVGSTTALISRLDGDSLEEDEGEEGEVGDAIVYNPQPYYAFTADVNAAGTDLHEEVFFIREVSGNDAGIRLIALSRGTDVIDEARSEQSLDADNRWKVGVGADLDGNGVDEIVLMQANGLRFLRYEASGDVHLKSYRGDEALATDAATIRAGNLDAIGYESGASVDYEITGLDNGIPAGEQSSAFLVQLSTTSAADVQYQIQPVSQPTWITGFSPRSGVFNSQNGANLTITVNSIGLAPGTYSFNAVLTTTGGDIINIPLTIPIEITVSPSLLDVNPGELTFVYQNCVPPHNLQPEALTLTVEGTIGVRFNAVVTDIPTVVTARESLAGEFLTGKLDETGLLKMSDGWGNATSLQTLPTNTLSASSLNSAAPDDADWLTVTPDSGTVEASITVTITPSALLTTTTTAEALLIIIGDTTTGNTPDNMEFVPIRFLCAAADVYLPLITKQNIAR